jgi:ferredoxin
MQVNALQLLEKIECNLTRTVRRRHSKHPTRDGNHNPVCIDPNNCDDCNTVCPTCEISYPSKSFSRCPECELNSG